MKNNKKKRKKLTVGIFVDFMGVCDITPKEEIKEIEDLFTGYFPNYKFFP